MFHSSLLDKGSKVEPCQVKTHKDFYKNSYLNIPALVYFSFNLLELCIIDVGVGKVI